MPFAIFGRNATSEPSPWAKMWVYQFLMQLPSDLKQEKKNEIELDGYRRVARVVRWDFKRLLKPWPTSQKYLQCRRDGFPSWLNDQLAVRHAARSRSGVQAWDVGVGRFPRWRWEEMFRLSKFDYSVSMKHTKSTGIEENYGLTYSTSCSGTQN